jgi:hypothetical protein
VSIAPADNPSGHVGLFVVFTNTASRACTMYGYPGVSFLTGPSGSQINQPARRFAPAGPPVLVRLGAGGQAHADLLLVNVDNFPSDQCRPTLAAGVRVYPPDETAAVFVPSPQRVCTVDGTGLAQISSVRSGATGP